MLELILMAKTKSKTKSKRTLIAMVSQLTGHRRVMIKNSLNTPDKLELNKYDPLARKVALYRETNKNLGRNEVKPRKK